MAQNGTRATGPRCIALVGPFQSGKTTLLEAILARTGAIQRQGTVDAGTTVGDASKEARHHRMSVELSVATTNFMGESYTFVDCPGSVEFVQDMRAALPAVDAAVVVCEMDEKKVPQLQLILRELEDQKIPRFLFLNKIDKADSTIHDALALLQPASRCKLLLRQIPTFSGDIVTGFVDLALERAFVYKEHAASEVVPLEGDIKTQRFSMLETLADHDDELMEQLLGDIEPPKDKVFDDLVEGIARRSRLSGADGGGGAHQRRAPPDEGAPPRGARRRHHGQAARRQGRQRSDRLCAQDAAHRTRRQDVGCAHPQRPGRRRHHLPDARARGRPRRRRIQAHGPGHREARPRADRRDCRARQARPCAHRRYLTAGKQAHPALPKVAPYPPVLAIAVAAKERKDDVKLGQALHRLLEEDPSVTVVHNPEAHEVVAWGQGEMHLRVATERLADRFGVAITTGKPSVGYRETIKKPIQQRGRHKKQSGGHGQYGDIVVDIKPMPRGSGFTFEEAIKGGVVPRNYIPSVEEGVQDALKHGPLGFPVVDVAVKLVDGSYHTVDSSDMAFQLAGRLAMNEGLPQCQPVLLEPIYQVEIVCPSEATAKMNALMSGHRGQILGFDTREGWDGWDVVKVQMPEAEIGNLIIEVRSATAGVGSFTFKFDHMAELIGRTADQIMAARKAAAAA